ncbi:MAG: pentapeptide repeat-containing protein, partial [Draconibacterium sp.]|nr:pentapeptide repeat-containing protein [Draconibacterium sp.]
MTDEHLNILRQGKDVWNTWILTSWKDIPPIEMRSDKVLRRTKIPHIPFMNADLSKCDLTEFKELKGYNFKKVNFSDCNLRGVDFSGSEFRKANFSNADLRNTIFDACNCEFTNFIHSNLNQSSLKKANLQGANLSDTSLFKTDFSDSKLAGCRLM